MKITLLSLLFVFVFTVSNAQKSAKDILEKCIAVHDPQQHWKNLNEVFNIEISRLNVPKRIFFIDLNIKKRNFSYRVKSDKLQFEQGFKDTKYYATLNGTKNISPDLINKYDLDIVRTQYLREVYEYLLLLPMRLESDLQFLDTEVSTKVFNQKSCYRLTFKYLPLADSETWFFFINKDSHVLEGYQFYKKNIDSDGEFITLSDYAISNKLLMPYVKTWYWNNDKTFFRKDTILSVK